MDKKLFLQKDNINILWDVIRDEDIFKFLTKDIQTKISQVFLNNIKGFYETEILKTNNITDINKKYILLILNYIKKSYPHQMPTKIKILDEPNLNSKELITYEEIQNDRVSQFDKDLVKRQEDFTNAMTLKVPNVPEFTDNYNDEPIKDMSKIIKEMTSKRNYEVEQINRNYLNNNNDKQDNWLKPQETSIKKEKFVTEMSKKNVTWGENTEIVPENEEDSIFKKLKKIKPSNNNALNNINLSIKEYSTEDKITELQSEVKLLNTKLDKIMDLLNKNNI
jgi:hypothetical protein